MSSWLRPPPVGFRALQLEHGHIEPSFVRHPFALGNWLGPIHFVPVVQDRRDPLRVAENADVGKRVAVDDKYIGARTAFERSDVAGPTERGRIVAGRRLDRRHRTHADELDPDLGPPPAPLT